MTHTCAWDQTQRPRCPCRFLNPPPSCSWFPLLRVFVTAPAGQSVSPQATESPAVPGLGKAQHRSLGQQLARLRSHARLRGNAGVMDILPLSLSRSCKHSEPNIGPDVRGSLEASRKVIFIRRCMRCVSGLNVAGAFMFPKNVIEPTFRT